MYTIYTKRSKRIIYNNIMKKIKRYFYYEKKITPKLSITHKLAQQLFLEEFKLDTDIPIKDFLIQLKDSKTNPVLNKRSIRKPRNKKDWRFKYENYLQSKEWKHVRENLFKLRGRRCEDCQQNKKLQVHHLHYNSLGNEIPEDLKILCKKCHKKEHIRLKKEKRAKMKIKVR